MFADTASTAAAAAAVAAAAAAGAGGQSQMTSIGAAGSLTGELHQPRYLTVMPRPMEHYPVAGRLGAPGRSLQAAAADCTGEFFVSSSLFGASAGCYAMVQESVFATADGKRIIATAPLTSTSQSESVWVSGEVINNDLYTNGTVIIDPDCHSEEYISSGVHPADASVWLCDLDGSGMSYDEVSAEEFSAECGCPEDSIIPTAPATDHTTPAPSFAGDLVCGELDQFHVTVEVASLDDVEGCYQEAGTAYQEEGGHFFSITGKPGPAQMAVFPGYADTLSIDARWYVGYYASAAADVIVYCVSDQSPADVHPSVASWSCDFTGSGVYVASSTSQFSVNCGCKSSSSSTPVSGATPSPTLASTSAGVATPAATLTPVALAPTVEPNTGGTQPPAAGSRAIDTEGTPGPTPEGTSGPTPATTGFDPANAGTRTYSHGSSGWAVTGAAVAVCFIKMLLPVM